MSGTGESVFDFAGEEREFRIRLGEIRQIQIKCGAVSIGEVARRLARAATVWQQHRKQGLIAVLAAGIEIYADDVREPIYQGLVGKGMAPSEATRLIRVEIDDRGLMGLLSNIAVALNTLIGAQAAPEGDTLGEQTAGESPATLASP